MILSLPHKVAKENLGLGVVEAPQHQDVSLKEERVFAQIGERGEPCEHRWWVLDSGATNHMTGSRFAFTKLDSGIRGFVKFGDGFVIDIEECGTILFIGNGGEHHRLSGMATTSQPTEQYIQSSKAPTSNSKTKDKGEITTAMLSMWQSKDQSSRPCGLTFQ
jgi:hypothetical protein